MTALVAQQRTCGADGCSGRHRARGFCHKHYIRLMRHGDARRGPKGSIWRHAHALWKSAKHRAQKRDLNFSITVDFIFQKMLLGLCEATGAKLREGCGPRTPMSPSLDRVDPSIGYTLENTRLVCWIYNAAKGEFADADVRHLAALVMGVK